MKKNLLKHKEENWKYSDLWKKVTKAADDQIATHVIDCLVAVEEFSVPPLKHTFKVTW